MVMALPFSTVRKCCPDDYTFIVQYQRIVKAWHRRFHVGNPCLGPALLDFAVPRWSLFPIFWHNLDLDCGMVCCRPDVFFFWVIRVFGLFSVSYHHIEYAAEPRLFSITFLEIFFLFSCANSRKAATTLHVFLHGIRNFTLFSCSMLVASTEKNSRSSSARCILMSVSAMVLRTIST